VWNTLHNSNEYSLPIIVDFTPHTCCYMNLPSEIYTIDSFTCVIRKLSTPFCKKWNWRGARRLVRSKNSPRRYSTVHCSLIVCAGLQRFRQLSSIRTELELGSKFQYSCELTKVIKRSFILYKLLYIHVCVCVYMYTYICICLVLQNVLVQACLSRSHLQNQEPE
jgi:hypothetical protein